MVAFIDDHRKTYGVEPICRVLPIAPSTYFRHKAEQRDPRRRSARAQRDEVLRAIIRRICEENHRVYGPRKAWKQMGREGLHEARGRDCSYETSIAARVVCPYCTGRCRHPLAGSHTHPTCARRRA
jgi:hypothetical protein